ncbi:cys-tRNA(Pro)/Cys-tRNA(Cys) deacylase ybaK [Mycobacteroides abscessus]|uniref:Cys-tRNA(Pro)/Cys-tRNA(Cys) deacylase n=2 Tax=Mycobacteroides abscessus TaxID=36809 RepID=A0A0U0ZMF6_9MYCO|nr:prolyl-tRNA synthetase [Mycobacteroides abscessus subsp. massiliense str. GO 06]MBE5481523.1 Cys-tRNA(Pro) deacylase [Mycobacteroides abscessus]SKD25466.1 cys-tRNA(Pro)/Cys-tRNA(Cys) deacylase ybaK [Mycobacteroides abscessus subsp. massiliense]QOF34540.1 Cys-tRNA(Pro) deacylase [Mycobacteroides abscessus]CPR30836.1 cys-tRNA(Pro)/Cys-tRNA(Cys) deacylase ybaK [Mycobacteroides abscessus]
MPGYFPKYLDCQLEIQWTRGVTVPLVGSKAVKAATPAVAALIAGGAEYELLPYEHRAGEHAFGDEAVRALAGSGLAPEQIFKTLLISLDRGSDLAVAVIPVPATLSLKAAAAALGRAKATMADPATAERSSGYVVGGISPLGQRKQLPTVIDASALTWERILCSAGKRGLQMALAPDDLVRLTGAVTASITAG